jgi:hypothetical protein
MACCRPAGMPGWCIPGPTPARFESYLTDPRSEPDSEKWQAEIWMRLADRTA